MHISVSPRFVLDTQALKVTETTDDGREVVHGFGEPELYIRIFEDRMKGWFFDPAKELLNRDGSVAAVHIVTPLIEAIEERYQGMASRNQSTKFFKTRAEAIFGISGGAIELLHKGLRCGFAHHGFLKDDDGQYNILIANYTLDAPIVYKDEILYVSAPQYVDRIHEAYNAYYREFHEDARLRDRFMDIWNPDWQMSLRVPGGCGTSVATPEH